MWIFLNDAFVSIVEPKPCKGSADPATHLIVRARVPGDLERAFPGCKVVSNAGTDYRFRTILAREVVAKAIAARIAGIDYTNFKDSTKAKWRHDAYMRVWGAMYTVQGLFLGRRRKANKQPHADYRPSDYGMAYGSEAHDAYWGRFQPSLYDDAYWDTVTKTWRRGKPDRKRA